jgi:hypothetical protein
MIIESVNLEPQIMLIVRISIQNQRFPNPSNYFFLVRRAVNVIRLPNLNRVNSLVEWYFSVGPMKLVDILWLEGGVRFSLLQ